MATLMRFDYGPDFIEFQAGGDYPASRPVEIFQVVDRTAAGTLQVEDLGVAIQTRVIEFNEMSITDYHAVVNWFLNVVNGSEGSFQFTDERGYVGTVKIVDRILNLGETYFELFSGTLTLEYV